MILKSLLESGISYFTSYPGSPISTVTSLVDRVKHTVLKDLDIYSEESTNEAAAAAIRTLINKLAMLNDTYQDGGK